MKKNTMMRVASALLVAVLMTTCAISGTFAKYITTDTGSDSARVAKWGVTVEVEADADDVLGSFAKVYANDGDQEKDKNDAVITNTVEATTNVVAPGTKGDLLKGAEITGTPEVAVNVETVAILRLTGWEVDGAYYCPLTITVDDTAYNGMDYDSADKFVEAVLGALNSDTNYAANTNLAEEHAVAWAWAFTGGDGQTDELDTKLGDAATNGDIKIDFSYTVTVEQID